MSIVNRLRDLFLPPAPPSALRNKPDGMAWIKLPRDDGDGSFALHRRMVQTVCVDAEGYWMIDPPQQFRVHAQVITRSGSAAPGDTANVYALHDDLLEPIRPVGDGERDESLVWLPPVPTQAPELV